jgi:hypothetical protein
MSAATTSEKKVVIALSATVVAVVVFTACPRAIDRERLAAFRADKRHNIIRHN